jgi:hypothetical protein
VPLALTFLLILAVSKPVAALGGALITGSWPRRALGLLVVASVLPLAWMVPPEHTLVRSVLALATVFPCLRAVEMMREKKSRPTGMRMWQAMEAMDTRRIVRGPSLFDGAALTRVLSHAAVFGLGALAFAFVLPRFSGAAHVIARALFGLVCCYALSDAAYSGITFVYGLFGLKMYPLHIHPIAARSVKEFWGERWNRTVNLMLFDLCLRPLARRGMTKLGIFAAFVVSALLHAYLVVISLDAKMTLLMLGYFLVQGLLVLVEVKLKVPKWSPVAGHAWTIFWMVLTSPGFVEPAMRIAGV